MFLNESESVEYDRIDTEASLVGALDIIYESDIEMHRIENAMILAEHRAIVTEDISLNEAASDFFRKIIDTIKKFMQKIKNWIEKYFRKAMDRFRNYSKWYEKNEEFITGDVSVKVNTYPTLGVNEFGNIIDDLDSVLGEEREGKVTQAEIKEEILGPDIDSVHDAIQERVFGSIEQKERTTSPGLIKEAVENIQGAEKQIEGLREKSSTVREVLDKAVEQAENGLREAKKKDDVQDSELSRLRTEVSNRQTEGKVAYTVYTQLVTARSKSAAEAYRVLKAVF